MTGITFQEMRDAARDLRDAIAEHDQVCVELPGLLADHKLTYLKAHAASTTFHPERKVREHEVAADEASFDAWARLTTKEYALKALKEKMHSLRQILSAYQTQVRTEGQFVDGAA